MEQAGHLGWLDTHSDPQPRITELGWIEVLGKLPDQAHAQRRGAGVAPVGVPGPTLGWLTGCGAFACAVCAQARL